MPHTVGNTLLLKPMLDLVKKTELKQSVTGMKQFHIGIRVHPSWEEPEKQRQEDYNLTPKQIAHKFHQKTATAPDFL